MKYDPIKEEREWWAQGVTEGQESRPFSEKHNFPHNCVRSKLYDTLLSLQCNKKSRILDVGCGTGEDARYIQELSREIVGVDISPGPLKKFVSNGFQGILANVEKLPFRDESFDFVLCSGLLHHLTGQGDLTGYLREFVRVTKKGGYVVALEPNAFHPSGILMNIFNTIKPGITGLVPHERALSPFRLTGSFRRAGLTGVDYTSASYVWNRLPLTASKFIARHEDDIRKTKPFSMFGWFIIVTGRKQQLKEAKA